jgi:glutamate formiminotransferase
VLECVVNISEGRNIALLAGLAEALSGSVLDVHTDADHNRSVFTLVGEDAPRLLTRLVVERLSLDSHEGVHPRLGVVDVVPFVPLTGSTFADAERARDDFARWLADELSVPVFSYGAHRTLPFIRAHAWRDLQPDAGPDAPHPTAGAVCAGAREPLVAYNVWLRDAALEVTRRIARDVRTEHIRTLGLQVGGFTQVSMNLVSPAVAGPMQAFDRVVECAARHGVAVSHAELVGLVPAGVLSGIPRGRWEELDLSEDRTIEARLAAAGISR